MKDASRGQPQGMLYVIPQRPHRHPLRRTPGAGGIKYNIALWPPTRRGCHGACFRPAAWWQSARTPAPPPAGHAPRQPLLHPSRQPSTPLRKN
jgi:hypothetical protein